MTRIPAAPRKRALDKDLAKITALEAGGHRGGVRLLPIGLSVVFLAVAWMLAAGRDVEGAGAGLIIVAAVIRSEEHTSELQSLMRISYAVFCLTKKKQQHI